MKTKAPIALASVTLVSERDSTLVLRGATDLQGGYLFSEVKVGRYLLRISFLGYKPLERRLRIVMPSQGFTVELSISYSKIVRCWRMWSWRLRLRISEPTVG